MNDFETQWSNLSVAGYAGGRLRVYPDHVLDFFLNYSLSGRREVIIEAKGIGYEISSLPTFDNLEVEYTKFHGGIRIGLTLNDDGLIKSFSVMCFDLAMRSKKGDSVDAATGIAIECLRNWADLFRRRANQGQTRNEAIGLWGELTTIESMLMEIEGGEVPIIQGWRGPDGDQRDIGFNGTRVEVKTQLSTRAISLRISSLDQLDDHGDQLKVVLNRISPSTNGLTLVELVARLELVLMKNNFALSEFERKMELSGFVPEHVVSSEKFCLDEKIIYAVSDDFPRLIPANVPIGINSVEYEISGPILSQFQVKWKDLMEQLNE